MPIVRQRHDINVSFIIDLKIAINYIYVNIAGYDLRSGSYVKSTLDLFNTKFFSGLNSKLFNLTKLVFVYPWSPSLNTYTIFLK